MQGNQVSCSITGSYSHRPNSRLDRTRLPLTWSPWGSGPPAC